jgi:hypothetical protein
MLIDQETLYTQLTVFVMPCAILNRRWSKSTCAIMPIVLDTGGLTIEGTA